MDTTHTKRVRSARKTAWVGTLNNFTELEHSQMLESCRSKQWGYIIGREVGAEGTPHLQFYIKAKNAVEFDTVRGLFPRAHIEPAKGKQDENFKYCSKEGNFETNLPAPIEELDLVALCLAQEYPNVIWRNWQQKVLDLLAGTPDGRKIHWILDSLGHSGKSYLAKYIALTKNVIIADGKKNDVYNQVLSYYFPKKGPKPSQLLDVVILDLPRDMENYLGGIYGVLEKLKDGCIYSGKYEGGQVCYPKMHVIVFANFAPDFTKWSQDRYDVTDVQHVD